MGNTKKRLRRGDCRGAYSSGTNWMWLSGAMRHLRHFKYRRR
jgi:hypothetical protein